MNNVAANPFDLNLARAYSAPAAFCPRPDLDDLLARSVAGQLWTLIVGDRRMGKSSSVIATAVRAKWPILHVDLMGINSEEEITERFRWAWRLFLQHEARGFFTDIKPELSAKIPGTTMAVKLTGDNRDATTDPVTWGDVLIAFDRRVAKKKAIIFIDEFQDPASLSDEGKKMTRSLRAALQMAHHITPILAGSSNHLLAPLFATSAAAFFKAIRLQHHFDPFGRERFGDWANEIFRTQKRSLEKSALARLFELTEGVTEDLVASCAEIWVQESNQRPITPADIEFGWRSVVANATPLFLPKVSALPVSQARLLRYVARNPRTQPFSDQTLRGLGEKSGPVHKALKRLLELELLRQEEHDGRKRIWVHDPRLAFYLRT
jgi:hypothetical protein